MVVLRQLVKRTLSTVLPERWWLTRGPRRSGAVALTFDDGPHPQNTALVLDHLKRFDMHATFFVIGRKAAQCPELIRRMIDEGHDVANHSYFHGEPSQTSAEQLLTEVTACRTLLARVTGRDNFCFRPPKGELGLQKLLGLWQQDQAVVLWNVDSRDYTYVNAGQFEAWCRRYSPASGDIILMHDDRAVTAEALPVLLEKIQLQTLKCVPVLPGVGLATRDP